MAVQPNVIAREFSPTQVVEDLLAAKGVIANGGFTLLSESIYLGKPVLSLPIAWQYEQRLNARQIEKLGYGLCGDHLTPELFHTWLEHLPQYRQSLKDAKFDNVLLLNHLDAKLSEYQG